MAIGDTLIFGYVQIIQSDATSTPRCWYALTAPPDELGNIDRRYVHRDVPLTAGQQVTLNNFITTKTADLKAIGAVGASAVIVRFVVDTGYTVTAWYTLVGPSGETVMHRRRVTLTAAQQSTLDSFMATKLADLAVLEGV